MRTSDLPGGKPPPDTPLGLTVDELLQDAYHDTELRRRATERRMEEIHRRLRHVAYLVANLDLRLVIPKLNELASRFPNAGPPRKEGLHDRIWVEFTPTTSHPVRARIAIESSPTAGAESLRVTVSAAFVPEDPQCDHEACFELRVENPDTKGLAEFLDLRILRFVKDYLRTGDTDSSSGDDDPVTDPVCKVTLPRSQVACSLVHEDHRYSFCAEGCRRKFEAAPEHYLPGPVRMGIAEVSQNSLRRDPPLSKD